MKNPTIIDWIKSTCSSIGWRLFIWGIGISQEEYWHRIYLQERDGFIDKRRVGNSTRIVDNLIQDFFKKGKCVAHDHYHTREASLRIFNIVLSRLKNEHDNIKRENIVIDKNGLTLINLKHELHNHTQ